MEFDFKTHVKEALDLFEGRWALVTAGTPERFNTMTIGWGGLGNLWQLPVATVYVKPVRYTHDFLDEANTFTVSFFGPEHRKALALLGTKSGRDGDKVAESGLTPKVLANGITFEEASVTLVCKKIYKQELDIAAMPQSAVDGYYRTEAPHTMYVGQVMELV